MMGTQFGPYAGLPNTQPWVQALAEGNMSMPTTLSDQAQQLGDKSIGKMRDVFADLMAKWQQP